MPTNHNVPREENFSCEFLIEHRDGNAPNSLAGDTPVRPPVKLGQHALTRGGWCNGYVMQTGLQTETGRLLSS